MNKKTLLLVLIIASAILGQQDTSGKGDAGLTEKMAPYIKLSGEAGVYGEVYSMSGRESRRDPTTGRIFLRPTLTFFEKFNVSFDLYLSTEGSDARQQLDQLGLHPSWGWGTAHIGDFSHEFSRYTLNGVSIRGGGIEINPGLFRLHLIGGQTQRSVSKGPYESAYSRYLFGAKIGIGTKEASHFDINIIQSKDDISSLSRENFMTIRQDSIKKDSVYYPKTDTIYSGITPQENLVVGTDFVLKLFDGMIQWKGELAASAYTKDLYSQDFKYDKIPGFVTNIFQPKLSTNADYAYSTDMIFNTRMVNVKLGYKLIGPGYTSLGIPSIMNDKKTIDGSLGLNFLNGQLILQTTYSNQQDNVVSQKLYTTSRNDFSIMAGIRPITAISLVINYVNNNIENDTKNDTIKLKNVNNTINTMASFQFGLFGLNHVIITNYAIQMYQDKNILRSGNDVTSQNMMLNITTMIGQTWSISEGIQFNTMGIKGREDVSTFGLNFRLSNRMFENKLNNSASFSLNSSSSATSNNLMLMSSYSLTKSSTIAFNYKLNLFSGKGPVSFQYTENIASLGYTYRF